MNDYNDDYLIHYGIKGMKWGVRRTNKSFGNRIYSRAAKSAQKDADDLRKHGYKDEAVAVQKVADKNRQKAAASQKKYDLKQAKKASGEKRYSNRQIKRDMNETYNATYKDLHEKYKKTTPATAADRAHIQAKKINTKHLIDTYGKERMNQYYATERKKTIAAGTFLVGSMASMSVVALVANRKL